MKAKNKIVSKVKPKPKKKSKSIAVFDDKLLGKKEKKVKAKKKEAPKPEEPKKKFNPFKRYTPKERAKKDLEEREKREEKRDKIFENNYNMGNVNTQNFPEIRIESEYASNLDDCYNAEEYTERKKIMEEVVEVFKNSQWGTLPLNKKFSKELMPYIFNDLFKALDNRGFSVIDVFICIAEFMDVSYERVYEIAGLRMKEKLIKELEEKYKILSKKHINRLF